MHAPMPATDGSSPARLSSHPWPVPVPARAFSILELLVTLTILAVLIGLTVAASVPRLQQARRISCLSHLRSWGVATQVHAADHADLLPHDGAPNGISTRDAWYVDLPPLMGLRPYHQEGPWRTNRLMALPRRAWICPSNPRLSNGRLLFHYALNRRATGEGREERQRVLSSIPDPDGLVWMFDNGGLAAVAAEGNAHPRVHGAGGQFLFLDGHVQRLPNTAYWDMEKDRPRGDPVGLRWRRDP